MPLEMKRAEEVGISFFLEETEFPMSADTLEAEIEEAEGKLGKLGEGPRAPGGEAGGSCGAL